MKVNIKKHLSKLLLLSLALVTLSSYSDRALADISTQSCKGIELATGSTTTDGKTCGNSTESDFKDIITNVINILSILVGAVSVIMLIVGGFRYIISNGDSNSTKGAKDTIMYALIGLIIVLFAQAIVRFVWTNASGSTTEGGSGSTPGSGFMLNNLIK
jgi:cytochrome bd-type quinol oxidase subunit 2